MDTDICLYCEKQLFYNTNGTGFCSRACHSKEAAKTQIPSWATPSGPASSRIQKAIKTATAAAARSVGFQYHQVRHRMTKSAEDASGQDPPMETTQ